MTIPEEIQQIVRQSLQGWKLAGVTSLPGTSPTGVLPSAVVAERTAVAASSAAPDLVSQPNPSIQPSPSIQEAPSDMARPRKSVTETPTSTPSTLSEGPPPKKSTLSRAKRATQLQELSCHVAGCTRCGELAAARTQTVFGVGNPEARLLFLGEAPGADEDKQGEPFVGRAGQLLNKIIEAMKLKREDLYICNILRCRPPGNRNPSPEEAANCREWLDGQLRIVDPDYIVCWGTIAAQNLLNTTEAISKMRGRFMVHGRAKVLCTYHPSYLLRNPSAKKPVWEDMQLLLREMGLPVPK